MKNISLPYFIAAMLAFVLVGFTGTGAEASIRTKRNMSGGFDLSHTAVQTEPERSPERGVGSSIQCACDGRNDPAVNGKTGQTESSRKARPAAFRNGTRKL